MSWLFKDANLLAIAILALVGVVIFYHSKIGNLIDRLFP